MKVQYNEKIIEIPKKIKISELLKDEIKNSQEQIIAAKFNNEYVNLDYEIEENGTINLISTSDKHGMKIYIKTLIYIMGKAFEEIYPQAKIRVNYQLSKSMYCEIDNMEVTDEILLNVKNKMTEIIKKDLPIEEKILSRQEAQKFYDETDSSKGRLQFDNENNNEIHMQYCENYCNYIYGGIATRTGITKLFDLLKYSDGFLLRYPSSKNPNVLEEYKETKKLLWALDEYDDIHRILNVETVFKLNRFVKQNKIKDIIMLDEALHEKKIAGIADEIAKNKKIKMVLIAGPSSSGKTTFAQRLGIQLKINGLKPVTISVDNYFVERPQTPRDENGEYDFEALEAIDLNLFNEHLIKLLNGEEIEMPEFDFYKGTKRYNGKMMKLADDEILVIEGIHCLNDKLTSKIAKEQKYKIYISALTVLNLDRFNRISTTDTRLVRRIVRDYQFRGYTAKDTIKTWYKVNRGEEKNIFPFQEEANSIFNTSLIYELGALKSIAMPLLEEIKRDEPEYAEAKRIKSILEYFETINPEDVPKNSLIKEFLGGGNFA